MAFGVANCDGILLSGSLGVRETGTTNLVSIDDRFHIGSLGKGLLAFMAGKLVDEGKISWRTKFFDLFPEMKATARKEFHEIDLKDLLSHRARLNHFNDWQAQEPIDKYNALHPQDRFSGPKFANFAMTLEPEKHGPGDSYKYSTLGYLLASLMLEKASGLIEAAKAKAAAAQAAVDFRVADMLSANLGGPYDILFDRGVIIACGWSTWSNSSRRCSG